jgi:phosphate transport system protein
MVADLERMGDLSVHVAKVARLRVPLVAVPDELVPTIQRMAAVAEKMVGTVAGVIADRDVEGARRMEQDDEEMDRLRRSSFRLMLDDSWPYGVEAAVDIALLGRYYERIADHAVSLARRVVYLVTGETVGAVAQ